MEEGEAERGALELLKGGEGVGEEYREGKWGEGKREGVGERGEGEGERGEGEGERGNWGEGRGEGGREERAVSSKCELEEDCAPAPSKEERRGGGLGAAKGEVSREEVIEVGGQGEAGEGGL